jgi:uncharacterized spore protein YtfJ
MHDRLPRAAQPTHFWNGLADLVGVRASVRAVFGDPIERGDATVVPVARVRWGFGGGTGRGPAEQGSGSGGGGGVASEPVGYLLITSDSAAFQPINVPIRLSPALVAAAGHSAALVLGALSRLVRG